MLSKNGAVCSLALIHISLGVLVDRDLSILTAGGYLLQLLPGASDAEITHLEQNVAALPLSLIHI